MHLISLAPLAYRLVNLLNVQLVAHAAHGAGIGSLNRAFSIGTTMRREYRGKLVAMTNRLPQSSDRLRECRAGLLLLLSPEVKSRPPQKR
jgi:hypothetical protein